MLRLLATVNNNKMLCRELVLQTRTRHTHAAQRDGLQSLCRQHFGQVAQHHRFLRCASTAAPTMTVDAMSKSIGSEMNSVNEFIPQRPAAVETEGMIDDVPDAVIHETTIELLSEPTLVQLGLGGWSPIGLVHHFLEFLHISCGFPWWASIALGIFIVV